MLVCLAHAGQMSHHEIADVVGVRTVFNQAVLLAPGISVGIGAISNLPGGILLRRFRAYVLPLLPVAGVLYVWARE